MDYVIEPTTTWSAEVTECPTDAVGEAPPLPVRRLRGEMSALTLSTIDDVSRVTPSPGPGLCCAQCTDRCAARRPGWLCVIGIDVEAPRDASIARCNAGHVMVRYDHVRVAARSSMSTVAVAW